MAANPRPLSTTEGFLLGGAAASVAVSLDTLHPQLPDHLFRLLFRILQKWQKQGCNYRVNL
jgi:hypothetical protein